MGLQSCSKHTDIDSKQLPNSDTQADMEFVLNVTSTTDPLVTDSFNFGRLARVGDVSRRGFIYIANKTGSNITFPAGHFVDQLEAQIPGDYIISTNSCDGKTIRNNKKCRIGLSLKYSAAIEAAPAILLNVTTDEVSSPYLSLVLDIDLTYLTELEDPTLLILSRESVNMGIIPKDGHSVQRVVVVNKGNTASLTAPSVTLPLPTGVSIENDLCGITSSPISLRAKKSCSFFIRYDYQGVVDSENSVTEQIVLNSPSLSVGGTRSVQIQALNVADINASTTKLIVRDLSFPENISIGSEYTRRMFISNPTGFPYTFSASEISSQIQEPYTVRNNTCDGETLKSGSTCYIDVTLSVTSIDKFDNPLTIANANTTGSISAGVSSTPRYNDGVLFESKGAASNLDGKDPSVAGAGNRDDILSYQLTTDDIKDVDVYNKKFQALNEELNAL